jgi:outer membrane protein OmpA-like peptidoglycan-associated protein
MSSRTPLTLLSALALAWLALGTVPSTAEAQFGRRLKDAVKRTAEDKAIQKATDTEGKAIDGALAGGGKDSAAAPADSAASAAAGAAGGAAATGETAGAVGAGGAAALKPGEGAWANYDFKPGDRILYASDFSGDEVGDFPKSMEFKGGGLELVEWQGSRYLRANEDSKFYVVLPEILPERFTMEFDYSIPSGGEVWIYFTEDESKLLSFGGSGSAGLRNSKAGVSGSGQVKDRKTDTIRRARVMGDGKYLKVYLDDTRVMNVPNADVGRSTKIQFFTDATAEKPTLFGNFRVAAGGKKLYDALTEKGRVATQGIYFDTGSDRIRPESTPTLKEIGAMLKDHPELKLTIEGHTDNIGSAESNQTLSEKRAAAVRQVLVDSYQVDGGRLQAKGFGATKPAAKNETPEGRQQNRRVELVKM